MNARVDRRRSGPSGDRRGGRRVPVVAAVLDRSGETPELAQAQNLGPRGMRLVWPGTAALRPPSTPLVLRFELPGSDAPLDVAAEVVFEQPQGAFRTTGVRFADLDDGDARRIEDYLDACAATPR